MALAGFLLVRTWVDEREQARTLARGILQERLATVVRMIAPGQSETISFWEGEITGPWPETWRLEMQTTAARFEALNAYLEERSPIPMTEVIATPLVGSAGWLEHVGGYVKES